MKTKIKQPTKIELIVMAAVLFFKSLLTQPFYTKLFGFAESVDFIKDEILVAAGAILLSVAFSFMLIKTVSGIGENAKMLMVLAVAEPFVIATLASTFHVLAVIVAVVCVAVCINIKNRILSAIITVAASALISFVMPCSVFSLVLLVVLVLLITSDDDTVSVVVSLVGAAISVAASFICIQLSDDELRVHFRLYEAFGEFGGSECHDFGFDKLANLTFNGFYSGLRGALVASLPIVAVTVYVAVKAIRTKAEKKNGIFAKVFVVAAIFISYASAVFASTVCPGNGWITGFNFVPLMLVLAFAAKGNGYVLGALENIYNFAKSHPIVSVVSIIWLASYSAAFAVDDKVYSLVTQFAM